MYRALIIIFICLFCSNTWAISLGASVDRATISIDDTLLLTVTLDAQNDNDIDISALELQFDILQRQYSRETSIINRKRIEKTQWSILLSPKETGELIIPSLSFMGVYSEAIKITVNDKENADNTVNKNQAFNRDDIFLEAIIDKNTVFVQEQILLTLRLYYRISLSGYTASNLAINNSIVELSSEKNFNTTINGIYYNVLEKIYAIHPQSSGTLTIPRQLWKIEKEIQSSIFSFQQQISSYVKVRSQAHSLTVLSIPKISSGEEWLPASSILLTQKWKQSTSTAKVGEPLNYSLTLKAEGLHHSQLPSINLGDHDHFTIYRNQPEVNNILSDMGVTGIRTENYSIVPKLVGNYTLPSVSLKWWNINSNQEETITLEAQPIIVNNAELSVSELYDSTKTRTHAIPSTYNIPKTNHGFWQFSTILLIVLNIILFMSWYCKKRANNYSVNKIKEDKENIINIKPSLKSIYNKIDIVIKKKQWNLLSELLQEWASIKTQIIISSNQVIIQYFPELKKEIKILEKQLYSENCKIELDSKILISLLKKQIKSKNKNKLKNKKLRELYPN